MLKLLLLFTAGGLIYGGIEVAHRGFTHISMFIVGGICFLLIGAMGHIRTFSGGIPVTVRMLLGSVIITLLELVSGLIVNVWLNLDVWDYTDKPFNFMGQICLRASAMWVFLTLFGVYAYRFASYRMFGEKQSPFRALP